MRWYSRAEPARRRRAQRRWGSTGQDNRIHSWPLIESGHQERHQAGMGHPRVEGIVAVTLLSISIIPNPFIDAGGIISGRLGYPVSRFFGLLHDQQSVPVNRVRVRGPVEHLPDQLLGGMSQ